MRRKTTIATAISIIAILAFGAVIANPESAFAKKLPAPVVNFIKKVSELSQGGFSRVQAVLDRWFQKITGYTFTETIKAIIRAIKNFIVWVYKLVLKILEWAISLFP